MLDKYDNEIAYSYDKYVEDRVEHSEDDLYEDYLIERIENMERKVIFLKDLTTDEQVKKLVDYVWKGDRLIPAELLEGE